MQGGGGSRMSELIGVLEVWVRIGKVRFRVAVTVLDKCVAGKMGPASRVAAVRSAAVAGQVGETRAGLGVHATAHGCCCCWSGFIKFGVILVGGVVVYPLVVLRWKECLWLKLLGVNEFWIWFEFEKKEQLFFEVISSLIRSFGQWLYEISKFWINEKIFTNYFPIESWEKKWVKFWDLNWKLTKKFEKIKT